MRHIAAGEHTPEALLAFLKERLGTHMKINYFKYTRAIEREKASINRILNLQERAVSAVYAGIAAIMFGISTFLFRILYEVIFPNGFFDESMQEEL